jgi:hypothetical protein
MDGLSDNQPLTSTTPMPLTIAVGGLEDTAKANDFAQHVGNYLQALGTAFDLSRLEGMTITDRYSEALTQVDRGFSAAAPVTRSENEDILGVAMCVQVLREDVPKVHLVCDIEMLLPIWVCDPGATEHAKALQLLAHECAHIEDLKRQDDSFPGVILRQVHEDWLDTHFLPIGLNLWQEYYACRRTAHFYPAATLDFSSSLARCLERNQLEVNDAIKHYRDHSDLELLVSETLEPATRALRIAAYMFGHIDGIDQDWQDITEVRERLNSHRLDASINAMLDELRRLWDMRNEWTTFRDIQGLADIARDAYAEAGVIAKWTSDGGAYLDVPFTAETMP